MQVRYYIFAKERENNQRSIFLLYIINNIVIVFGWYLVKLTIMRELKLQRKPQFFNTTGNNSTHKQQFWIYKSTPLWALFHDFFSFKLHQPPILYQSRQLWLELIRVYFKNHYIYKRCVHVVRDFKSEAKIRCNFWFW